VPGIRVHFGNLPKPGIDDYVQLTCVSSATEIGSNTIHYLRVRDESDLVYLSRYVPALLVSNGFKAPDGSLLPVNSRVRLVDGYVYQNPGSYFVILYQVPYTLAAIIAATTDLETGDYVTVTGVVTDICSRTVRADHVYWGGSAYGAMSLRAATNETDDGTAGGGPFHPWPGPTADEILASDMFQVRYNSECAIGWALAQPDGAVVDLPSEMVISESEDGLAFGLKETFEPLQHAPQLTLILNRAAHGLHNRWPTVDIVGGMLTTLSDGRRAIVNAKAVYVDTDASGRYYTLGWTPKLGDRGYSADPLRVWPWRAQIAP